MTKGPTDAQVEGHDICTMASHDIYKDVHKGIRAELFAVTNEAGRADPSDEPAVRALAEQVSTLAVRLSAHASHEDTYLQPLIEAHVPGRAVAVVDAHVALERKMTAIEELASRVVFAPAGERRALLHRLYLDLATFTSRYLEHQDDEERYIMPALDAALGTDVLLDVHQRLVASIPPDELAQFLALMIPAMNIDDRAELLGGMRANAPGDVFSGTWALTTSVLPSDDLEALAERVGVND
jgi:hypothetical protein